MGLISGGVKYRAPYDANKFLMYNLPRYVGKTPLGGPGHAGYWIRAKFKSLKDLLVQHHLVSGQTKVEPATRSPLKWRKADNQRPRS